MERQVNAYLFFIFSLMALFISLSLLLQTDVMLLDSSEFIWRRRYLILKAGNSEGILFPASRIASRRRQIPESNAGRERGRRRWCGIQLFRENQVLSLDYKIHTRLLKLKIKPYGIVLVALYGFYSLISGRNARVENWIDLDSLDQIHYLVQ